MRTSSAGMGLALISAATFGTSGSFASSLLHAGWTPAAAVTVRVALAAVLLTVPALVQLRGRWADLRRSLPAVLAYGLIAVAGCQLFYFNAVQHLSVGVALLLEYSGTLLVVLWMWALHGQRPRRLTLTGGALALIGLALVLDLTGGQRADAVGLAWGLAAAVGLAFFFVVSARGGDAVPPLVMAWAGMITGALVLGALGLVGAVPVHASTADVGLAGAHANWLVPVLGLSLVAGAIAYTAGINAARVLGARLASFLGLAEVLFAVLFSWALLGQRPTVLQAIGGLVVLAGITLVRVDDRQPAEPTPVPGSEPASPGETAPAPALAAGAASG